MHQSTKVMAVSALGSAPTHLSPILVVALLERGFSLPAATLAVSFIFIGELVMSVLVLTRAFQSLLRVYYLIAGLFLLALPWVVVSGPGIALVLCLATGLLSGFYSQIGILTAARSQNANRAFMGRFSFALVLAGAIGLLTAFLPIGALFPKLVLCYGAAVILVIFALRSRQALPLEQLRSPALPLFGVAKLFRIEDAAGIGMIVLFFVCITGLLASLDVFLVFTDDPMSKVHVIALSKIVAGIVLLRITNWRHQTGVISAVLLLGLVWLGASQLNYLGVVLYLVVLEVAINGFSSSVLAGAGARMRDEAKSFIFFFVLLGCSLGPVLAGGIVDGFGADRFRQVLFVCLALVAGGTLLLTRTRRDRPAFVSRRPDLSHRKS